MKKFLAALALLFCTPAGAVDYPCSISPPPVLCYSVEKLVSGYNGNALTVQRQTSTSSQTIGFTGNSLNTAALNSFMSGDLYARVVTWNNQISVGSFDATQNTVISATGDTTNGSTTVSNVGSVASLSIGMSVVGAPFSNGTQITAINTGLSQITVFDAAESTSPNTSLQFMVADTPRIYSAATGITLGGFRALSFQGGTQSGRIFGLNIPASLTALGISPRSYTVFIVARPTSSMFRNQANSAGLAQGTLLSLEGGAPVTMTGNTVISGATITNLSNPSAIGSNWVVQGPGLEDGAQIVSVDIPTATATLFGSNPTSNNTGATYSFSNPLATYYSFGGNTPGALSVTDNLIYTLEPNDTTTEINPVVISYLSDATGVKIFQNEVVRSSADRSARPETVARGFMGRMGGRTPGQFSRAGDFWAVAVLVYNQALTQQQRAVVSASLYNRFSIDFNRSKPSVKSLLAVGDSIPAGYVANANFGMFDRLANARPAVRFGNYSVPGSTVTPQNLVVPAYAYTVGMFPGSVAPVIGYSKIGNYLVVLGGGNDMLLQYDSQTTTITGPATPAVFTTGDTHGAVVGQRVAFDVTTGGCSASLPAPFVAGAVYYIATIPGTFTVAAAPGGAAINSTTSGSGTFCIKIYRATAASIMSGIQNVVDQALAAMPVGPSRKVWVATSLPRVGVDYNFIMDQLNTLIRAGGSGNYSIIDFYTDSCLATNPGVCYGDSGHPSDTGHQHAADLMNTTVGPDLN